ncbi:MAG: undecaprenyl/decaprenyl-phosphate alpha-N-acetylglucosaminyl 1-phosphate transferase [Acidobacteriota bacterium]|nr:undecaprenyl/decaprenyl-phosphate alpha-N-acetylglucosaminyl 1-phosphate transferase [Acidobacteriota bacterium]
MAPHSYLLCFLASGLLSLVLTREVRQFAIRRGWIDRPENGRHIHRRPVPRIGGLAIFIAFGGTVGTFLLSIRVLRIAPPFHVAKAVGILAAASVVLAMGLFDDLRPLGPWRKFTIESVAAVLLYLDGFGIRHLSTFTGESLLQPWVGLPLTVFWVLLITNAFNLIDGLDGLAAGSALFSTVIMFVISLLTASPLASLLTIILAGAILGFLRYNFHPASIFLGDSGSLFIGFVLSAVALAGSQKSTTMIAVAIPVVSLGLPILDVLLSIARRFLSAKPLFSGDDDHIHHKLLKRGFSQREAVLLLYGVTASFGLLSLALLHSHATIALVLVVIGLGVGFGIQQLRYAEFSELFLLAQRTLQPRRFIAENLQIRRGTDALGRCFDLEAICRTLQDTLEPLGFDGFAFRSPHVAIPPDGTVAPLLRSSDGRLQYAWNGFGTGHNEPGWELTLELVMPSGERWGQFSLLRAGCEDALHFDINLLSGRFRERLVEAAERAISSCWPAAEAHSSEETRLVASVTVAR